MSHTHHKREPRKAAFATRIIAAVREQPGATVTELARHLGCAEKRLDRVLKALADDGTVRQDRGCWYPAGGRS